MAANARERKRAVEVRQRQTRWNSWTLKHHSDPSAKLLGTFLSGSALPGCIQAFPYSGSFLSPLWQGAFSSVEFSNGWYICGFFMKGARMPTLLPQGCFLYLSRPSFWAWEFLGLISSGFPSWLGGRLCIPPFICTWLISASLDGNF